MPTSIRFNLATCATCIQVPLLAIVSFGDFGFHFSGLMGDLRHMAAWTIAYATFLVIGVSAACLESRFRLAAVQIAAPIVMIFGWWIYLSRPEPHYDATTHQFLVGRTIEEVERTLGRRRIRCSGLDGYKTEPTPEGGFTEYGTQYYNGMTILYSKDNRVIHVINSP
jgi:hypothetical protein